ncbi:MAG: hypothetical protein JWP16_201 [Alphaproteobacteria bacterium]|nr:hypothetical protein [Alphaproteobacteria bacterium]
MNKALLMIAVLIAATPALTPAMAQRNGNYPVQEMNFDLWCQEQAGLAPERCDKRTPQDEATFEAYRSKVEAYEIPYLAQKASAARLDRDILRADPIDNPLKNDPAAQRQDLNTPSTTTPPR